MRTVACLLGAMLASACSSSNTVYELAAPTEAGLDTADDCSQPACDSPMSTPDQWCGVLSFKTSTAQSRLRNHHTTYAVRSPNGNGFIVAAGGFNAAMALDNVDVAPIAGDGGLGAFVASTPLAAPLGGQTGTSVGSTIVVAGGQSANGVFESAVFTSNVSDDGTVSPWSAQAKLAHPRMHAASFAYGKEVYVLGGFAAATLWDDVWHAAVAPDGSMSHWTSGGTLPSKRSHFGVAVAGSYVFITGGLNASPNTNPPALLDVQRARIADDGTLVEWTAQAPFPYAVATHSSFFYGGYVYVVGGIDVDLVTHLKRIVRAPVGPDHTLGAWADVAALPRARGHVHQTPVFNGHVYSVSGAIDFTLDSTPDVVIGSFL